METPHYYDELAQIKAMMERSTKFLSLAGWSGIVAGVTGVVAALMAANLTGALGSELVLAANFSRSTDVSLLIIALVALTVSIAGVVLLSNKKARRDSLPVWTASSRRFVSNMAIPLAVGGILSLTLALKGVAGLIPAVMLLFYGLAMFIAGNFTFGEIRYMGMIEMALGLLAVWFPRYSLVIWAIGFGLLHIVYGIYLHLRYEK